MTPDASASPWGVLLDGVVTLVIVFPGTWLLSVAWSRLYEAHRRGIARVRADHLPKENHR